LVSFSSWVLSSPCTTLFPYTTLFRSEEDVLSARGRLADYYSATAQVAADMLGPRAHNDTTEFSTRYRTVIRDREDAENWFDLNRSEEHTSELQSRFDLVCRLLLEKKK